MNAALPSLPAGYRLSFCETIDSTNDEARRLARAGADEGTIVWAVAQTAGRGRRGRNWVSPPGNLYMSIVLRPRCPPGQAAQLGFAAALAIGDAAVELVPELAGIACKWPNDVLLSGRKIAGILIETEGRGTAAPAFLILGLGLNLAVAPSDVEFPAISIAAAGFVAPAPGKALEAVVRHLESWTRRWREQGFAPLREAWRTRAVGLGERISVRLDPTILHGTFVDIDQQGALLLETESGLCRVSAGDVFPAA